MKNVTRRCVCVLGWLYARLYLPGLGGYMGLRPIATIMKLYTVQTL